MSSREGECIQKKVRGPSSHFNDQSWVPRSQRRRRRKAGEFLPTSDYRIVRFRVMQSFPDLSHWKVET